MAQFFKAGLGLLAKVGVAILILFPFLELFDDFKVVEVEGAKELLKML